MAKQSDQTRRRKSGQTQKPRSHERLSSGEQSLPNAYASEEHSAFVRPKVFSYVIDHDYGSAPNPFFNFCTLCGCKPVIRRCARPGDWVVANGKAGSAERGRLVFAMQISERMTFEAYARDRRFDAKRRGATGLPYFGDQGFDRLRDGRLTPLPGTDDLMRAKKRANAVLIARRYYYFGDQAITLPRHLRGVLAERRGHRRSDAFAAELDAFLRKMRPGVSGRPSTLPEHEWEDIKREHRRLRSRERKCS